MDQRVSLRRFIVPALVAGLTLAWSSAALAREPASRIAVTTTHLAPAARASHPTVSATTVRSTASHSIAGASMPTKTVAPHLNRGVRMKSAHEQHGNW
jgi:hypothetical protein